MNDLLVKGRLLLDGELRRASFGVKSGLIVAAGPAAEALDFGEAAVFPGAIDAHVHFRDPGNPEKEDFASGSRAAALGGVTTVLDMPNTNPPVFTAAALADKLARAEAKSVVDFGLFVGLDEKGESIPLLSDATAMKIYLGASTGNLLVRDMDLVRRALLAAAQANRTITVHAESQDCLDAHAHLQTDAFESHSASRPAKCEADAILALAQAARGTLARVHIAHISTKAGLAAMQGTGFTAEVAPHHLFFNQARLTSGPFKMNPPLREEQDREAVLRGLVDGRIHCLASDHAPHTLQEKGGTRMGACPSGVPGVQTMVPLLLASGKVPLARVIEASTVAAKIFRLPGKGSLDVGNDADFAVYDLHRKDVVRVEDMQSRAGWTPFEGMPANFPTHTFVRGNAAREARGRFVKPRA